LEVGIAEKMLKTILNAKWYFLTQFETKIFDVGTAEKIVKRRTHNGAF